MREYWMETERIGFSLWEKKDLPLAELLWGDPDVSHYICAKGVFTPEEIQNRLDLEIQNYRQYNIQYFPLFERGSSELIGCCGLRPSGTADACEIGFHLRKKFWHQGLAQEAASAMIHQAFHSLHLKKLHAGHNPRNIPSKKLLLKLGFAYVADEFYEPTGLMHPSYILKKDVSL